MWPDLKNTEVSLWSLSVCVRACVRSAAVHQIQPWFHGGVSRSEAERLLEEQGQVDG